MSASMPLTMNWADQGTSIRMDVISLIVALAIHAPLLYLKLDLKRANVIDRPKSRLVQVDVIDADAPKPKPAPVVKKKETGFMAKLKALVKKDVPPPPPPKPKLQPKKLDLAPKDIKLQPKLKTADPLQPKLKSKAGFKTAANPALIKQKKISLKSMSAGIAPLSAKKLGTVKNRSAIKNKKGSFQIAKTDTLSGIGGSSGGLADPSAPTIALKAGRRGSTEKFSAPPPQKANKGKFSGASAKGLGGGPKLGLRDSIIARDAKPTAIGGGSSRGIPGGVPGGLATKKNAGRSFDSSQVARSVGRPGVAAGGAIKSKPSVAAIAPKKKKKKKMFTITGPLKDRPVLNRAIPEYPGWAQAQGIEAAVILQFTVTPDGRVKNSVVVRRTSGYPRLDQSAIKALRQWRFAPLSDDANREEVGLITFNYSLS